MTSILLKTFSLPLDCEKLYFFFSFFRGEKNHQTFTPVYFFLISIQNQDFLGTRTFPKESTYTSPFPIGFFRYCLLLKSYVFLFIQSFCIRIVPVSILKRPIVCQNCKVSTQPPTFIMWYVYTDKSDWHTFCVLHMSIIYRQIRYT